MTGTTSHSKPKGRTMNKQIDAGQLLHIVERIENLQEEAAQIAADIKTIYDEAKSLGYDPKYIKKCVVLRAKDPEKLDEEDELMQMYRNALNI